VPPPQVHHLNLVEGCFWPTWRLWGGEGD
jgi:hypothetical protein